MHYCNSEVITNNETCKTTLTQKSVATPFKTKLYLDNTTKDVSKFKDITKGNDIIKDETKDVTECNWR